MLMVCKNPIQSEPNKILLIESFYDPGYCKIVWIPIQHPIGSSLGFLTKNVPEVSKDSGLQISMPQTKFF